MPLSASAAAELRLAAVAASVRAARRFVRQRLTEAGRDEWSYAAELVTSEVVTNAVLHAHTEVTLRVTVGPERLEVEVEDGNPMVPTQRLSRDAESTTGRGLELVTAMTQDRGVRVTPHGKVVWFTIGDAPETDVDDLLDAWDDDAWEDQSWATPPREGEEPGAREVVLDGMPATLWIAAREHHQALLRELVLHLAGDPVESQAAPDMTLVDEARNLIWSALLAEIERARVSGRLRRPLPDGHPSPLPDVPESLSLRLSVPARLGAAFGAMQDALDTGERLAVQDRLLVRPALPEIVAVRDWACEQVVAQLAGVPSSPWPGADQPRFTDAINDRAGADAPDWDVSQVTGSDRGVVAADDANRILAISRPLADATGWEPADVVGRRVVILIPPELREAHVAGFSRHLTTGEAHVLGVELELPVLHRDGTSFPCRFMVERAPDAVGRAVYLAWIDPL